MADKPMTPDDTLLLFKESLDGDILTDAMTDAEVDQELRDAGGDPDAIARDGKAFVAQLLERRRLAWQDAARKKIEAQRAALQPGTVPRGTRTRPELLAAIQAARTDPRVGGAAAMTFHKRKPEEASTDELEEMLEEFEMLRRLGGSGGQKTE
jgi:hypothetical protein